MIDLQFDLSAFERKARDIGGAIDQVPFALANALTSAAFKTREALITDTWARSVTVRSRGFLRAALRVEPARKHNLKVAIYDEMKRGSLALHATGGIKGAKGNLAIPTSRVARGAGGVRKNQRPRNLSRAVRKGNLIFQEYGSKKKPRLRLMYKLASSARIKKDVPFHEDFRRYLLAEAARTFPASMKKAMATRRG